MLSLHCVQNVYRRIDTWSCEKGITKKAQQPPSLLGSSDTPNSWKKKSLYSLPPRMQSHTSLTLENRKKKSLEASSEGRSVTPNSGGKKRMSQTLWEEKKEKGKKA